MSPSAGTVLYYTDRNLRTRKKKKPAPCRLLLSYPGDDLLSHTVPRAVPSALKGLTSVFGKGTGVAPSLWPPEIFALFDMTMAQY